MSTQTAYALRKAAIMVGVTAGLAILGAVSDAAPDVIKATGVDGTIWLPVVGSLIAGAVRWIEGVRDGQRAATGDVIPSDVRPVPVAPGTTNRV